MYPATNDTIGTVIDQWWTPGCSPGNRLDVAPPDRRTLTTPAARSTVHVFFDLGDQVCHIGLKFHTRCSDFVRKIFEVFGHRV